MTSQIKAVSRAQPNPVSLQSLAPSTVGLPKQILFGKTSDLLDMQRQLARTPKGSQRLFDFLGHRAPAPGLGDHLTPPLPIRLLMKPGHKLGANPARSGVEKFVFYGAPRQQIDRPAPLERTPGQVPRGKAPANNQQPPRFPLQFPQVNLLGVQQGLVGLRGPFRPNPIPSPQGCHNGVRLQRTTIEVNPQTRTGGFQPCDPVGADQGSKFIPVDQIFTELAEQSCPRKVVRGVELCKATLGKPSERQRIGVGMMDRRGAQMNNLLTLHLVVPPVKPDSGRIKNHHLRSKSRIRLQKKGQDRKVMGTAPDKGYHSLGV